MKKIIKNIIIILLGLCTGVLIMYLLSVFGIYNIFNIPTINKDNSSYEIERDYSDFEDTSDFVSSDTMEKEDVTDTEENTDVEENVSTDEVTSDNIPADLTDLDTYVSENYTESSSTTKKEINLSETDKSFLKDLVTIADVFTEDYNEAVSYTLEENSSDKGLELVETKFQNDINLLKDLKTDDKNLTKIKNYYISGIEKYREGFIEYFTKLEDANCDDYFFDGDELFYNAQSLLGKYLDKFTN